MGSGQIHVNRFLMRQDAVAVERGELSLRAEFCFGANVEGGCVVQEPQHGLSRQGMQRRNEREFVCCGVLPLGAVESEACRRSGDHEFLETDRRHATHRLRVPIVARVGIRLLIAVVGELQMLRIVAGNGNST